MTHTFLVELTDEVKGYEDDVDYLERVYGAEEFDLAEHDKQLKTEVLEEIEQIIHNIYTQDLYCMEDLCEMHPKGYDCEDCLYNFISQNLEQYKNGQNKNEGKTCEKKSVSS